MLISTLQQPARIIRDKPRGMTRTAKKGRKRHLEASQWEDLCEDGGDGSIETTQSVDPESVTEDDAKLAKRKKSKKVKLEKNTEDDEPCEVECKHQEDKPVVKKKKKSKRRDIIPDAEVSEKRLKRREHRRTRRANNKICFNCRGWGHRLQDCPKRADHTGLCFKCGSSEHSSRQCRARVPEGEFPFAKCFICKQVGHLSSTCPDNPKGLYPKGGGCNVCGSVEHLKVNCPELKKTNEAGNTTSTLSRTTPTASADADRIHLEQRKMKTKLKTKNRVVKF